MACIMQISHLCYSISGPEPWQDCNTAQQSKCETTKRSNARHGSVERLLKGLLCVSAIWLVWQTSVAVLNADPGCTQACLDDCFRCDGRCCLSSPNRLPFSAVKLLIQRLGSGQLSAAAQTALQLTCKACRVYQMPQQYVCPRKIAL